MPTFKELSTRISKTKKDIANLKNKLLKDTELLFKQSLKELFKKHKNLESFAWTQYTPYWNDGDTCVFGAHTDYIYLNGEEEAESYRDKESLYKDLLHKDKVIKKLKAENEKLSKTDEKWTIDSNNRRINELLESDIEEIKWKSEALKDIAEILESADDDTLLRMFDDHVKILVTKDGIETESYQHD